jgi:hypothetical protein
VDLITNLPSPSNFKELRSFLGYTSLHRRFIKDFSKIARPLTKHLAKDVGFDFDDTCLEAFNFLKSSLVSPPIIGASD